MKQLSRGFTIVELIIVVVVIAILAAITVVAYNGAQDRAQFVKAKSDIKHINDAVVLYKSQTGKYPTSSSTWIYVTSPLLTGPLVPQYIDSMPQDTTYRYKSDGTDYKLIRLVNPSLKQVERTDNNLLNPGGTYGSTNSWGYWSDGGVGF